MECLYGTQSDNVAAICHYHKCGMTPTQIKTKNCLGKQCTHMEKKEGHQWWRQREAQKQKRKDRKERINNYVNNINNN